MTLFFPAKYEYLGRIIKIDTSTNAVNSVERLEREFQRAGQDKRERIAKASMLAANRARALQGQENISYREEEELEEIYMIYKDAAKKFYERLK